MHHQSHHDHLAMRLLGQEGHRRRHHDPGYRRGIVGCFHCCSDEVGNHPRGGREARAFADDGVDRMKPIMQLGDHTEVASPAPDRPEEVGHFIFVDSMDLAIGSDDLGPKQAVDGQPQLAMEKPDAPTQGETGYAHGPSVAKTGDQTLLSHRRRVIAGERFSPGRRAAPLHIDFDGRESADRSSTRPPSEVLWPTAL